MERTIQDLIAGGLTVVLVSHESAQAGRVADQAIVLDAGGLAERGPAEQIAYFQGCV